MRIVAIALVAMVAGCKRSPPPSEAPAVAAVPPAAADAGTPPRCKVVRELAKKDGEWIVGDAIASQRGTLVGLARLRDPEAFVDRVGAESWSIAKGAEMIADAPPPKPLAYGGEAYAAMLAKPGAVLARLGANGAVARLATFPVKSTESLSLDAAIAADGSRAAILWDDDAPTGGITAATARLDGATPATKPRIVSLEKTDADAPRVAPRKSGGFWVAWIERKAIAGVTDASEGPAEDRALSWVDVAAIDPDLEPRRITIATGHAASFDLAPRPGGDLDVYVRDDTQEREGGGGRIVRVLVHESGAPDEPAVIVANGVGRGSVDALDLWLAFTDASDHPMLAPLTDVRTLAAPPSVEDALEGGRLLATTAGGFVAVASEGTTFRDVTCAR